MKHLKICIIRSTSAASSSFSTYLLPLQDYIVLCLFQVSLHLQLVLCFLNVYVVFFSGVAIGLGEMMPTQLWETTMDPERRLLKQLKVDDAAEANVVFSSLMGTRVSNKKITGVLLK